MSAKSTRREDAIRRVELALPAAIAHRLAHIFMPADPEARGFIEHCKTVFNAVVLEPVEGLPLAKRESHMRAVRRLQVEMLDPYEGRGAVTVYAAAHFWLQDLAARDVLAIDPDGAFAKCWEALGKVFAEERENIDAWERCQRSAAKMAAEWRVWLEGRGYYVG